MGFLIRVLKREAAKTFIVVVALGFAMMISLLAVLGATQVWKTSAWPAIKSDLCRQEKRGE